MNILRAAAVALGLTIAAAATTGCASEALDEAVGTDTSELGDDVRSTRPRGIDVSHHNGSVDWAKVKSAGGQTFAFARISDGLTQPDPTFDGHWKDMKRAGLVRGAYQFFRARRDGVAQADLLLRMIDEAGGFQPGDLPPVLDIETADGQSNALVLSRCHDWLDRIESKLGVRPIVYTGNHMTNIIGTSFKDYVLWIAHYGVSSPRIPAGWTKWTFWQNSENGTVAGVRGKVDTNFFNGNLSELADLTYVEPKPAPTPSEPPPDVDPEEVDEEADVEVADDAKMGDGIRAARNR